jgi:Tfp pilus assembly PilM family ATPase
MAKKPSTVVAFEIGPSCLKFVEMPRNERRILATGLFALEPGRWHERAYLAAQIRSALDTATRGNVASVIASVPLGHAHLRVMEVPADAELRDTVRWEFSQYLARPLDAYVVDFQPMSRGNAGQASGTHAAPDPETRPVLAAAFHREATVTLREAVEHGSGLPLTALDVDAAAVLNAFAFAHPEHRADRILIVHANADAIALVRTRDGNFEGAVLRRDAGSALRPDAEAQDRAEGLLRCARGIVESLSAFDGGWNHPDRVFLCGDLAVDADFKELLRSRLPDGFHLLNPYRNMPGPDPADFPDAYPGARFCAATGLALRMAEEN